MKSLWAFLIRFWKDESTCSSYSVPIAILLFAARCFAQIPTTNLVIQYDMVTTGGGGTTLTDLSGNANDGTFHGTSAVAAGRSFNGSSDYISIPAIIKNSDFTAIIVETSLNSQGSLWYEGDSGASNQFRIYGGSNVSGRINSTTGDTGVFSSVIPAWGSEFHAYYLKRGNGLGVVGMLDRPYRASATVPTAASFTSNICGAIGSQIFGATCASQNIFFQGTIAYFLLYNRELTQTEMVTAYTGIQTALNSRPVFISDIPPNRVSSSVWNRMGTVIENAQEPMVMYETTNCQILSNPCFKMWASVGTGINYWESPNGMAWTAHVGAVLTTLGGSTVVKVGSTYHLFGYSPGGGSVISTHFSHYSSTDGIVWTLVTANLLAPGAANTWDSNYVVNPSVMIDNGTWYMTYDGSSPSGTVNTGGSNQTGLATSPDGITWTKGTANPITGFSAVTSTLGYSCQGTYMAHVGTRWYIWCAGNSNVSGRTSQGRYEASSPNSFWTKSFLFPSLQATAQEGYAADGNLLEVNGVTYMYYATGNSTPGVKLAIANMPMSQLVLTGEGAFSSVP